MVGSIIYLFQFVQSTLFSLPKSKLNTAKPKENPWKLPLKSSLPKFPHYPSSLPAFSLSTSGGSLYFPGCVSSSSKVSLSNWHSLHQGISSVNQSCRIWYKQTLNPGLLQRLKIAKIESRTTCKAQIHWCCMISARLEFVHFKQPLLSLLLVILSSYLQSVASNRLYWQRIGYPKMLLKVRSLRTSRFRLPTLKLSHWLCFLICTTPPEKKSSQVWMTFQLESGSFETTPTSYPLPHPSELQHLAPEKFTSLPLEREMEMSCKHPIFHRYICRGYVKLQGSIFLIPAGQTTKLRITWRRLTT